MAISDKDLGRNLASMRDQMSQKELAEKMAARGWKWSQATVWSVESGKRPLRFSEAVDLCWILDYPVQTLIGDEQSLQHDFFISKNMRTLDTIRDDIRNVLDTQIWLAETLDTDEPDENALSNDVLLSIHETPYQAFVGAYFNAVRERTEAPLAADEAGPYKKKLFAAWTRDLEMIRKATYGEHQEAP